MDAPGLGGNRHRDGALGKANVNRTAPTTRTQLSGEDVRPATVAGQTADFGSLLPTWRIFFRGGPESVHHQGYKPMKYNYLTILHKNRLQRHSPCK